MKVKELDDETLVKNAKELNGLAALENQYKREIKKRIEEKGELDGVDIKASSERISWMTYEEMEIVLSKKGIDLSPSDLQKKVLVSGSLKFQ